jgi:hypothetical protein
MKKGDFLVNICKPIKLSRHVFDMLYIYIYPRKEQQIFFMTRK